MNFPQIITIVKCSTFVVIFKFYGVIFRCFKKLEKKNVIINYDLCLSTSASYCNLNRVWFYIDTTMVWRVYEVCDFVCNSSR